MGFYVDDIHVNVKDPAIDSLLTHCKDLKTPGLKSWCALFRVVFEKEIPVEGVKHWCKKNQWSTN